MHSLVTGGAGFIGSHLAEALFGRGASVRIVDNFSTGSRSNLEWASGRRNRFELIEGDLLDPDVMRRACAGVDTVFHLAALPSVQRSVEFPFSSHSVNATGTLLLLGAAHAAGVRRFVYSASSSAYGGGGEEGAKDETNPTRPLSPYAVSKLAGEHYVRVYSEVYGLEAVSLRYFNIFGPRQNPDSPYGAAIPKFAAAMIEGRSPTVFGDGLQSRDFTYVENAVWANLAAAEAPAERVTGEVFNVGCGESVTLLDVISTINQALSTKIEPLFAETRLGDVRHSRADVRKAERLLGYRVRVALREGIRRTLEAFRRPDVDRGHRSIP